VLLTADLSLGLPKLPSAHAGGLVAAVDPDSPADRAGVAPGDRLLELDGRPVVDEIALRFRQDRRRLRLTVERDGRALDLLVLKDRDQDLGIQFVDGLFDGVRECNNRCSFCFLKGLPAGLRRSLYFKDDDYRLSFLYGNFVTLTNLSDADWARIAEERLSPLSVSVHTTDLALRRRLLGNPSAPDVVEQLRWLAAHGIRTHTQLVVLPGVNDGEALCRSIEDLAALAPMVESVGVVPVGLSERGAFSQQIRPDLAERLRQRGARPQLVDADGARAIIALARSYQRRFRRQLGRDLVYLADEYYLRAGVPVPPRARYDGYPQYQNGIGMVRDLLEQAKAVRQRPPVAARPVRITAVCGELIAPVLVPLLADLSRAIANLAIDLVPVRNTFFGASVTASGLLTSGDIVAALAGRDLGQGVAIPRAMLDSEGVRFLDDGTPADLERALGVPVKPVATVRELVRWAVALR
jgi:putative radical SAM enzyme (TIGR03279 family)